ncbi:hypothetical protein LZ31DRAFT_376827 [Colletotrichum somersetense]|nr:hypothetical protein LZ31DRAFT_376827 [Colletotrichum somersetense]
MQQWGTSCWIYSPSPDRLERLDRLPSRAAVDVPLLATGSVLNPSSNTKGRIIRRCDIFSLTRSGRRISLALYKGGMATLLALLELSWNSANVCGYQCFPRSCILGASAISLHFAQNIFSSTRHHACPRYHQVLVPMKLHLAIETTNRCFRAIDTPRLTQLEVAFLSTVVRRKPSRPSPRSGQCLIIRQPPSIPRQATKTPCWAGFLSPELSYPGPCQQHCRLRRVAIAANTPSLSHYVLELPS